MMSRHRRVGQLGAADGDDPVVDLLRRGPADAGLVHLALDLQVAEHRLPGLGQLEAHPRDEHPAGERMLELAVAVAELAHLGPQRHGAAGEQVHPVERVEAVFQLDAVGADVLHRRGAHRTGNERHVLQARQALGQRPGDEVVPVLAGAGLDDPGIGALFDQAPAHHLDLQHHLRHVAREHDVAAAAEDEFRCGAQFGVVDHAAHVGVARDAHQRLRHGRQAEAVVRFQAHARLDLHGRIFTDPSPHNRFPKTPPMPSFDAVLEPNLVEVRNAVDQTAKEIGTRFDFKGSSAKVELKEEELTVYADSDFQISQVLDILLAKMTKRSVDIRFLDRSAKIEKIGGDKVKQKITVKSGIDSDTAKKIQTVIKQSKMKVQAAIQGDTVRVTGGKRDDLQAAIALIRKEIADAPLSFNNFRD
jgi:uncharacterized protein YajQ (UPF0234 family)